ncbi:MAG: amidase [Chloroflexota bacterium]
MQNVGYRRENRQRLTRRHLLLGGALFATGVGSVLAARALHDQPASMAPSPAAGAAPASPPPTMSVLEGSQAAASPASTPEVARGAAGISLERASVRELRQALDARQISAVELVQACLDRIAMLDHGETGLHAVIEVNPRALDAAAVRDRDLVRGNHRGSLHGIPVLVKDVFATVDGMANTAGSLALLANAITREAFVITRLRQAGAIILGKTNLTEWSNFQGAGQMSGWSPRGGQTRNPYQLDHTPWGSSSGSAVAVAAGYAPLAVGVETDGSIVCPASATATVGLKPTVGLVSRSGVIPVSFSMDSPGPMARTVEDAAYLLSAIAGFDPHDPAYGDLAWRFPASRFSAFPVPEPATLDYTQFLDPDGLRGARIGVARNVFYDDAASVLVEDVLPVLEQAGATIVDPAEIPTAGELASGLTEWSETAVEFPYALEQYLLEFTTGPLQSLADIVTWNEEHAGEALPRYGQETFYAALESGSIWDQAYQETVAYNHEMARDAGLDAVLDEFELDALIAPTTGAPRPLAEGDDAFPGSCAQVSSLAGYPIISVPVGYVDGLPVGMSFMGRAFSEPVLLRLAYAFEQIYPVRQFPEFRLVTLG